MDSIIYFIQRSNGDVKIGTTINVNKRLVKLRSEHGTIELLGIIEGGQAKEKILHWCLSDFQADGEWFAMSPTIKSIIGKYATMPNINKPRIKVKEVDNIDDTDMTISDLQHITEWSYPTALAYATTNGKMYLGKWYIPHKTVEETLRTEKQDVLQMKARLMRYA